jgi:hypothetical protein
MKPFRCGVGPINNEAQEETRTTKCKLTSDVFIKYLKTEHMFSQIGAYINCQQYIRACNKCVSRSWKDANYQQKCTWDMYIVHFPEA